MLNPLLTVEDVGQILRVRPKTVHEYVRKGLLPCIQLSPKDRRFTEAQLTAFIAARTITPPTPLDTAATRRLPSPKVQKKGGLVSSEGSVRARLREELRSWR